MSCRFAHDDAAYVLGALAPDERLAFERHLADCDDCTRAVQESAGLPGLLARVDAGVLKDPTAEPQVPDTLLPALFREAGRSRRRRTMGAAALAAAVATVVAVGLPAAVSRLDHGDGTAPDAPASAPEASRVVTRPMAPVGDVPVTATLGLEPVTWGTRLLLVCTYEQGSVEYDLPPAVDYTLFVRTRAGGTEQVGSWRSVDGRTMRLEAATSADRADIASVEVRTPDGRVVLLLGA